MSVFRKFHGGSETNSLDLNRSDLNYGLGLNVQDYNGARSSFGSSIGGYNHQRSTSTESASSKFVHPFAQNISPRPYTPPIGRENDSAAIHEEDIYPPRGASKTNPPQHLRIQTTRRTYTTTSAGSQSNLHSPLTSDRFSPCATVSPNSVRSSFDRAMPRIRSRTELNTMAHADAVRQARLQFQEKQEAKERKYAEEEKKAMEKQTAREERKYGRKSDLNENARPKRPSDIANTQNEKTAGLLGTNYGNTSHRPPPFHAHSSRSESYRSSERDRCSTKNKTHNLWTEFVLWLRTRFLKISRRARRAHQS